MKRITTEQLANEFEEATGTTLTAIGKIIEGSELRWLENGLPATLDLKGFTHF